MSIQAANTSWTIDSAIAQMAAASNAHQERRNRLDTRDAGLMARCEKVISKNEVNLSGKDGFEGGLTALTYIGSPEQNKVREARKIASAVFNLGENQGWETARRELEIQISNLEAA